MYVQEHWDSILTLHHDIDIFIHSDNNWLGEAINLEDSLTVVGTSVRSESAGNTQIALCLIESTALHARELGDADS